MSQDNTSQVILGPTLKASEVPANIKIVLGKPLKSALVHEVDTVDIRPPKEESCDSEEL
jgi:hypothetical protein